MSISLDYVELDDRNGVRMDGKVRRIFEAGRDVTLSREGDVVTISMAASSYDVHLSKVAYVRRTFSGSVERDYPAVEVPVAVKKGKKS